MLFEDVERRLRAQAAAAAVGRLDGGRSDRSFLHTSGVDTDRGVFTT